MNRELEREANGLRRSPLRTLTAAEVEHLKREITAIGADLSVFVFVDFAKTNYSDSYDTIFVGANVFPDVNSIHPRDLMSERAVLAHEYYGHRTFRNTILPARSWNDEFRASYTAAKTAPNLTVSDRRYLILDALERAREAGVTIKHNEFIRGVLYGYSNDG
jgi:hypothetical protein